jgi:hypothetical protein
MSIAITEDHRALAQTVADFLAKHQARAAARGLLDSEDSWTNAARRRSSATRSRSGCSACRAIP